MNYFNCVQFVSYEELYKSRKRSIPFLLCFSNGQDPKNVEIIKLANSRCKKYNLCECYCIEWKEYRHNRRSIFDNEMYHLSVYNKNTIKDSTIIVQKSEFNKLFKSVYKTCKTDKKIYFALHRLRESRLKLKFANKKFPSIDKYISSVSNDESSLDLLPSYNVQSQFNTLTDDRGLQNQHNENRTHLSFIQPNYEPGIFQNRATNIQTIHPLSPIFSLQHPEIYPYTPNIQPFVHHSQCHTSNTNLPHTEYQPTYERHYNIFPLSSPQASFSSSSQFSSSKPVSQHTLPRQCLLGSQPTATSSLQILNQPPEKPRPSRQPSHHQPPTRPYRHSIDDIISSSSSSPRSNKIFRPFETSSSPPIPHTQSSTQGRSTIPSAPSRSPSHLLGSASESTQHSSAQISSTLNLLHQPWKDITSPGTQSISSGGKITNSLTSPSFHHLTPYSRPINQPVRQSTHLVTNRIIIPPSGLSQYISIPRTGQSQNHSHNRNGNNGTPSSPTHSNIRGPRTGSQRTNRSPNRSNPYNPYTNPR